MKPWVRKPKSMYTNKDRFSETMGEETKVNVYKYGKILDGSETMGEETKVNVYK